jgi:hypothetical protein
VTATLAPPPGQDTGQLPPKHLATLAARAGAVVADYDQVQTWSDPSARQCELARLGAAAVELLRHLGAAAGGAGGRHLPHDSAGDQRRVSMRWGAVA